jgi:hypothetical protein
MRTTNQVLQQQNEDAARDIGTALTPMRVADDGWSEAADEASTRTIRGQLIKFADWRYTKGKEATLVAEGTELVAIGTAVEWVKWEGGKPAKHLARAPGQKLPTREELGDNDKGAWELGPDKITPKDPWALTRYVYFVDPRTAEAFTFSTSSWGGREAVVTLADAIARMRSVHADAVPVVGLYAAEMPTRFGRKSKPTFKIIGWKSAGGTADLKQLTHAEELNDEIPH